MTMVFLSYSTKDHFFAELADIKLLEGGIALWRDKGQLRAGSDWRQAIERGISESVAILVALSSSSCESSFVTYEWAYALGKGKPVIPLKLSECVVHPKLEPVQYLDFRVPGALPWESLIERIQEIETDDTGPPSPGAVAAPSSQDAIVKAILAYLDQRGYQMASFDRLRRRIDDKRTDQDFKAIIDSHPSIFRHATLKDNKPGLAKVLP